MNLRKTIKGHLWRLLAEMKKLLFDTIRHFTLILKDKDPLYNKGLAFYNLERYQEAIVWYDKALATDPKNPDALDVKGESLAFLRRYQEAIISYDNALAINATNLDVLNNKTIALALAGQKQEALTLLEKGLSLDPNNRNLLEVRSQLQWVLRFASRLWGEKPDLA